MTTGTEGQETEPDGDGSAHARWIAVADRRPFSIGVEVVLAHLLVVVVHGLAHGLIPVDQPPLQQAYVVVVVVLGPLVALALVRRGSVRAGAALLAVSMAGSLVFGGVLHFVLDTPDHVAAVPADPWRLPFRLSAVLLVVTEALGTVAGALLWWQTAEPTRDRSSTSGADD